MAALALPPAPGEGSGDCGEVVLKLFGEFGELLKLFGEAGEASGEQGGDPIASRSPALPEIKDGQISKCGFASLSIQ